MSRPPPRNFIRETRAHLERHVARGSAHLPHFSAIAASFRQTAPVDTQPAPVPRPEPDNTPPPLKMPPPVKKVNQWRFDGDVEQCSTLVTNTAITGSDSVTRKDENLELSELERGVILCALVCVKKGSDALLDSNNFEPASASDFEIPENSESAKEKKDPHRRQFRSQVGNVHPVGPAIVKQRRPSIRSAASQLSRKMLGDPNFDLRMLGFFNKASTNPTFASYVARYLVAAFPSVRDLELKLKDARTARAFYPTLRMWAQRNEGLAAEVDKQEESPNLAKLSGLTTEDALIAVAHKPEPHAELKVCAEALTYLRPIASLCSEKRVCVWCLAAEMTGLEVPEQLPISDQQGVNITEIVKEKIADGGAQALEMAARLHNQEMHAANGNIYYSLASSQLDRTTIVEDCGAVSCQVSQMRFNATLTMDQTLRTGEQNIPAVSVSRAANSIKVIGSTPPARHQLLLRYRYSSDQEEVGSTEEERAEPELPSRDPEDDLGIAEESVRQGNSSSSVASEPLPSTSRMATRAQTRKPQAESNLAISINAAVSQVAEELLADRLRGGSSAAGTRPVDLNTSGDETATVDMGSEDVDRAHVPIVSLLRHRHARGDRGFSFAKMKRMRSELEPMGDAGEGPIYHFMGGGLPQELSASVFFSPLWIGVGSNPRFDQGRFSRTQFAIELRDKAEDPATRDGRVNIAYPLQIWSYCTNSSAIQVAADEGMERAHASIRPLLLKISLYDKLRQLGPVYPTGTEWGIPQRLPIAHEYIPLDEAQQWNFRHIVIHISVLDAALKDGAAVPVRVGEIVEDWALTSENVGLIVLDQSQENVKALWALQVLATLRYPLEWVAEFFAVTGPAGPDEYDLCAFLRTEGLVSMSNGIRNIIFVVTGAQKFIDIGGQREEVVRLTIGRPFPDIGPANSTNLVKGCLDIANRCTVSLVEIWQNWINKRVNVKEADWAEIDTLANVLVNRFLPQPEITVDDIARRTAWLPKAYIDKRYSTDMLPPADTNPDEDQYYATGAVTSVGQTYSTLDLANTYPSALLGTWSNLAELITGAGLGTYIEDHNVPPGCLAHRGMVNPLDGVRRAIFVRRGFEEFLKVMGLTEQVNCPATSNMEQSYWNALVYGDGHTEDQDTVASVSQQLLALSRGLDLRWDINLNQDVLRTHTGIRTSAGMWLTPLNNLKEHFMTEAEGYAQQSGVGGNWLEGRLAQTGLTYVDAPLLERALMKLDALRLSDRGVEYNTRPDNAKSDGFAFRLESSVFNILYLAAGWNGPITPLYSVDVPQIPDGWGLRTVIREWETSTFRTITLAAPILGPLEGTQLLDNIVQRGPPAQIEPKGTGASFLYSTKMGFSRRPAHKQRTVPEAEKDDQAGVNRTEDGQDFPGLPSASATAVVGGPPTGTAVTKAAADPARAEVNLDHRERQDVN